MRFGQTGVAEGYVHMRAIVIAGLLAVGLAGCQTAQESMVDAEVTCGRRLPSWHRAYQQCGSPIWSRTVALRTRRAALSRLASQPVSSVAPSPPRLRAAPITAATTVVAATGGEPSGGLA